MQLTIVSKICKKLSQNRNEMLNVTTTRANPHTPQAPFTHSREMVQIQTHDVCYCAYLFTQNVLCYTGPFKS